MQDAVPETTKRPCEEDAGELRRRLELVQADERRAQALLDSAASLMALPDAVSVMRGTAENAVRHVGFPHVSIYRLDHDVGVLEEVARVVLDTGAGEIHLPGMAPVTALPVDPEPIELRPGHPVAEFALSDQSHRLLPPDEATGGRGERLMVQMRVVGRSSAGSGVLLGVIVASGDRPPTAHQTGLLRSLASLAAAAAEAARVEEFRRQLVSAVSHELRTPLAAIRAYNELLLDEDAGSVNDEQRLFLQRIETTCMQLDRMVEDLLDLSKLRAGEMVISRSPVDVVGVIEHIIDTLSPEAARRHVSLTEEIIGELPLISSNSDRLAQVLFNLVGNAVKYVDEGGSVRVRASVCEPRSCRRLDGVRSRSEESPANSDGRCLVIEVIDDGPGIAADEMDRVFDEFFRGRLTERTTKGSGLGLAISSRLTRLLGGGVDVDSTPGEGSTFYLIFPIHSIDSVDSDEIT